MSSVKILIDEGTQELVILANLQHDYVYDGRISNSSLVANPIMITWGTEIRSTAKA